MSSESLELNPLPNCTISWVKHSTKEPHKNTVEVPVYLTPEREKLWYTLSVPCRGEPIEKIISGVAICISGGE